MKIEDINNKKDFSFNAIYLWTNLINGKVYVGQTQNFYNRMQQYKKGNDDNRIIGIALKKYGFDNFDISILEKDIPLNKLNEREQYWMDYYNSYDLDIGYNLCREAGTTRGFKHSEESKHKMSEIVKQRYIDNPEKKLFKERNGMYGKHPTEETLQKMSEASKKQWEDDLYRKNQHDRMAGSNNIMYGVHLYGELNGMYGKHHSNITKQLISKKAKERMSAPDYISPVSKRVMCVETNVIYNSMACAAEAIGGSRSGVSYAANKGTTHKGFHWKKI